MKVQCQKCKAVYNVSESKIPEGGTSITCKKCKNKIRIEQPVEESAVQPVEEPVEESVEESAVQTVEESVGQPVEESVKELVKEPAAILKKESIKSKWYDKKALVIILVFILPPIGIYALWKSNRFSKISKGIFTAVIAILLIYGFLAEQEEIKQTNIQDQQTIADSDKKKTNIQSSLNNVSNEEAEKKDFKSKGGWAFGMRTVRFSQIRSIYEDKGFKLKAFTELPSFQGKKMYRANFNNSSGISDTFALAMEKESKKGLEKSKFKIYLWSRTHFGGGEFDFRHGFHDFTSSAATELSIDIYNEIVQKNKSRKQGTDVITMTEEMKDCKVKVTFGGLDGGLLIRSVSVFDKNFDWERDVIERQ